jgi:hypothetical protein
VNKDAGGPGDEITTLTRLLAGMYEYWIELDHPAPAGDLTVDVRTANGRVLRSWSSPANPAFPQKGWHVFDIQGSARSLASVDQLTTEDLPGAAHAANEDVCP